MIYAADGITPLAEVLVQCAISKQNYEARHSWPRGELRVLRLNNIKPRVSKDKLGDPIAIYRGSEPRVLRACGGKYPPARLRELRKLKGIGRPRVSVVSVLSITNTGIEAGKLDAPHG
jgi:hypothetical protein